MIARASHFWLACAASAALVAPVQAQGLRATPGAGAPAAPRIAPPSGAPTRVAPAPTAPRVDTAPRPADYIVAVVNSEPITNNEVRARAQRVAQQLAQQGAPVPPVPELLQQVLERLISDRAQLQLARESGIRVDEAAIDQAELTVARQNQMTVPELRRELAAEGLSLPAFREDLRNQLLLTRLRERELESRVRVTELDVDQYMREQQSNPDQSVSEINLAHILVAVPENAPPAQVSQAQAKAQRAQERARAGEDFAKLAGELSDTPGAAANGGQVGLRSVDRYPPLFLEATQGIEPGGISAVVRSGAGFHVIKVIEKRRGGMPGAEVTQSRARHILLRPGPQLSEAAARARLADFKRRIESGQADFAALAREHSQDASARQGGELGWSNPGSFVPEFEDALDSLAPGQIADPIISRFGVHLVQLLERRQAPLGERERRAIVRNLVREKKLEEAYAQWAQDVVGRAYVEMREPPR